MSLITGESSIDLDQLEQLKALLAAAVEGKKEDLPKDIDVSMFYRYDMHPSEVYVSVSVTFLWPDFKAPKKEMTMYPILKSKRAGYDEVFIKAVSSILLLDYHMLHRESKLFKGSKPGMHDFQGLHLTFERLG